MLDGDWVPMYNSGIYHGLPTNQLVELTGLWRVPHYVTAVSPGEQIQCGFCLLARVRPVALLQMGFVICGGAFSVAFGDASEFALKEKKQRVDNYRQQSLLSSCPTIQLYRHSRWND